MTAEGPIYRRSFLLLPRLCKAPAFYNPTSSMVLWSYYFLEVTTLSLQFVCLDRVFCDDRRILFVLIAHESFLVQMTHGVALILPCDSFLESCLPDHLTLLFALMPHGRGGTCNWHTRMVILRSFLVLHYYMQILP